MLILSRKEGESVVIGDDVVVTVIHVGSKVRLAIEAPRNVKVLRSELDPSAVRIAKHNAVERSKEVTV